MLTQDPPPPSVTSSRIGIEARPPGADLARTVDADVALEAAGEELASHLVEARPTPAAGRTAPAEVATPAAAFDASFAADRQEAVVVPDVFIAALGAAAQARAFPWLTALNRNGIAADMLFEDKSLKSLMKRAGKLDARYVLIIGEQELADNTGQLRNMQTREQTALPLDRLVETLRQRLIDAG